MKRSLQRRLTWMLGAAIMVSGLVSALISFMLAYNEAKEFQDDTLRQVAYLTSRSPGGSAADKEDSQNRVEPILNDKESLISIIQIPDDARPDWLTNDLTPGLHTVEREKDRLRVFLLGDPAGKMTVVIQSTDSRDEIAINSALRAFAPSLLFLPIMAWLVMRIVRKELTPVRKLASHLDEQPTDQPGQLSDKDIPDEIIPFVHAINRLLERVVNLMGQQQRFVADAAHELRSPLTALSLQIQNLQMAGSLESMRARIVPLQEGIERARKLTEQLLNLAKIQARATEAVTVDISELSRALIAEYLPLAETKAIDLGLLEEAPLALDGVPEYFHMILKNALENALQYTPSGGQVTIRLLCSAGNEAGFEIIDSGPGIAESERNRVFDRFYRPPGSPGGGSGLGLAIAKEAATYQGGSVNLLKRPDGSGLIFRYLQGRKA